jgi:hypothetical protein
MRQVKWVALVAVLALVPQLARAQPRDREERRERDERGVARLMDRLRDEMWDHRRELNFFQRAPEYRELVDLRYHLRSEAMRVADLDRGAPRARLAQREVARHMEESARRLERLTRQLERHTDIGGAPADVRRHADHLKEQAERIRHLVGRLEDLVREGADRRRDEFRRGDRDRDRDR